MNAYDLPASSPTVGVIVGTYRRPVPLASALESLAAQTHPVQRIIVCDDASGDTTQAVVEDFAGRTGIPTVWTSHPHTGHPGRTRNLALPHLDGLDWVAFLDDDDTWRPDKLRRQMERIRAGGVDVLGCGVTTLDRRGCAIRAYCPPPGPYRLRRLAMQNPLATSAVIMRRSLLMDLGGFNEHPHLLGWGNDYDLWLRAAAVGARVDNLPDPLVLYRQGQGIGAAWGSDPAWRAENLQLIAGGLRHPTHVVARRILWGRHHGEAAEAELAAGRRFQAARHAVRAIWCFPAKSSLATLMHVVRR